MSRVKGITRGDPVCGRMSAKRKSLPTKISQARSSQESVASSCNDKTTRELLLSPEPVAASDMEFEEEEDDETEFHSEAEADDDDDRPAATGSHQKVWIVFPGYLLSPLRLSLLLFILLCTFFSQISLSSMRAIHVISGNFALLSGMNNRQRERHHNRRERKRNAITFFPDFAVVECRSFL